MISETQKQRNQWCRDWRAANPDKQKAACDRWVENNYERKLEINRRWRAAHREELKVRDRKRRAVNREHFAELGRRRRRQNPDKHRKWAKTSYERHKEKRNGYYIARRKSDSVFRIACSLRTSIATAIKRRHRKSRKAGSAIHDLGCTLQELLAYLQSKFKRGMTWSNYGKKWQLDHVKPLVLFDLTKRRQFLAAAHYTNLQPLFIEEHKRKTAEERGFI